MIQCLTGGEETEHRMTRNARFITFSGLNPPVYLELSKGVYCIMYNY